MPWRLNTDPYRVWLSEIMLQQTRVEQATPYFLKFTQRFPSVFDLAEADIHEILLLWEGLGYYSRARNMHETAQIVVLRYNGIFPADWQQMRSLKGVGDYTAAAVLSICHNQPYAVMDGNVIRVISRFYGIEQDVRSQSVRTQIRELAQYALPAEAAGDYNQAMMELGALVCTPKNPKCGDCPLFSHCVAARTAQTDQIPYKKPAHKVPHHTVVAAIIYGEDKRFLIQRRPDTAMLGGLWEFPGGKVSLGETLEEALHREVFEELGIEIDTVVPFHSLRHAYSHFKITLHAFTCTLHRGVPRSHASSEFRWIRASEIRDFPFPKANRILTEKLCDEKT